jgi:hypothetical protein
LFNNPGEEKLDGDDAELANLAVFADFVVFAGLFCSQISGISQIFADFADLLLTRLIGSQISGI